MTRHFIACSLSIALAGSACQLKKEKGSEFAAGVPRQDTVAVAVPGSSAQPLTLESQTQALQGQTAEWYVTTRRVAGTLNGAALGVGALVKLVTDYPPTQINTDSAIWGPWQGPLDPVEWKITVTRVAPHQYTYSFDGRDKHDPSAAFVTVLSGQHNPSLDAAGEEMEGFGTGSFLLDWDTRATLPGPDGNVGTASYTYSRPGPAQAVTISAKFLQVKDDNQPTKRVDVDYAFMQNPAADGSMEFIYRVPANATSAGGVGKVKSRWLWSGSGRSDVKVTSTDSVLTYTLSECWDTSYLSTYKSVPLSPSPADNYGDPSSCAFTTPVYSKL